MKILYHCRTAKEDHEKYLGKQTIFPQGQQSKQNMSTREITPHEKGG